jgi:Ca-activated chloride channel family protein
MFNKWRITFILLLSCLSSLLLPTSAPSVGSTIQPTAARPISIAIIFDLSTSANPAFQFPTIKPKDLKDFLTQLFRLSDQNRYYIIGFSTTPNVFLDGSTDSKLTLKALSKLGSEERQGATALYDACYLGIEKVAQEESSEGALLVVSDGGDNISSKTFGEVKRALVEKKVKLYAVVPWSNNNVPKNVNAYKRALIYKKALDEMASISGGAVFQYERSKDISPILASIVAKLYE